MNPDDAREKWNRIYSKNGQTGEPSTVLTENLSFLPTTGTALDIACGRGANSISLANAGLKVEAWDISDRAISHLNGLAKSTGLDISANATNITNESFDGVFFDVIVNCHYLDRDLTAAIRNALKPNGIIYFQTFTVDKLVDSGPSNPDYLLVKDELLTMFDGFDVLSYRDESANTDPNCSMSGRAYIVARKI